MHSNDSGGGRDLKAPAELAAYIDHTLLKAEATAADIEKICAEAITHKFKGICVNSTFIGLVAIRARGTNVLPVSVVGFPLGAMLPAAKARETDLAVQSGAKEIDTVIALGWLKSGEWKRVEEDIAHVVRAAGGVPVKVILETGMLTHDETVRACQVSESAGAAFVKTATGFLGRGASLDDIKLMRATCSAHMKIKASGGVKTFAQARELILAGADRIGTSSGVALVTGSAAGAGY
jgi:deoxyribose-phosphate aldolase